MSELVNHYKILGVHKESTREEMKVEYRKRARVAHPDSGGGSAEAFNALSQAYKLLTDDYKRQKFDKALLREFTLCAKCFGDGFYTRQITFIQKEKLICNECDGAGVIM